MSMPRMAARLATVSIALSGCSRSDLDRCIDSQMAVWKQQEQSYQDELKNYKAPPDDNETVNIGG